MIGENALIITQFINKSRTPTFMLCVWVLYFIDLLTLFIN
ncbi:3-demethylubiquinone-9 3-methyltransferase [Moraxella catarrhalis]|nr:3-demethylubiquinone-9 3-methyltransferase [Moraxella catarrhalis]